jgi:tetratricopeptide (TPR) repeat protein
VEKIPIKTRPESTGDASDSQHQMTLLIRVSQSKLSKKYPFQHEGSEVRSPDMAHDQTSEPEAALWARCVHYNTVLSQSGPSVTTLDETLPDIQRLLGSTPPDSPVRLRTMMLLASATLDRSLRSEQPHNNALNNVDSLLDELSNGSWVLRPEFQAGIAQLRSKVQQARRKAVIHTCRALAEQSLEAAEALRTKGDVAQIQAVNKRLRDLVATTPMNDTLRPGIISMLAENLLSCARGKEGYDVGYLSDAIDCLEQAFPSSSRSKVGPTQPSTSSGPTADEGNGLQSVRRTLYAALRLRYALLNKDEDLERMFALLPSGTDDPRALLELGELLYTRFELQKGNLSDINRSIDLQKKAIQMALAGEHENETTSAQPGRPEATWLSRAYNNLALAFEARFKLSDDLVDLYECLRYFRKTLTMPLAPGQDSSVHFGTFQHLASSLAYYALNHQDSDHLEEIMTLLVDLVSLLPPDGAERSLISPHLLWAVALTLGSMAKHLKNPDLLRALSKKMARPELNLYPGLSTAEVFQAYIDFNLDPSPETNAKSMPIIVKFFKASLASCDNIAVKLGLARILIAQPQWYQPSQGDKSTSLTSEGMTLLKECFNSPPEHDSTFHYFLGQLFGGPGGFDQFEKAMSHFARATSDAKLPLERLEAAYEWAEMALKVKSTDCMTAFDVIVTTISEIAGLERTIEKRHRILSGLSSRVLQAAEAALSFEEVDKALEFLERGRGLVWSQLNTLRTPLDELRSHDAALASRLESVSQMLEGAGGQSRTLEEGLGHTMEMRLALQEQEVTHIKWAREREELIESVRSKVPGFLRPLPSSEWLTDLPTSGPVVVLQAHKARCDAIVLVPGLHEPMHIPLPHFSPRRAGQLRDLLRSSLLENKLLLRGEPERVIREAGKKTISQTLRSILKQLWSGIVKPILDGLAFSVSRSTHIVDWITF